MDSCSGCWFRRAAGRDGAAFPPTLLRLPAALYGADLRCARLQPSGVPQEPGTNSCACFLRLSRQSGSGSQGLDGRCLPGAFCPQPQSPPAPVGCLRPVSRRDLPSGCRPSRISGGLRLETGGLFAVRQGLRSSGPSLPLSPPCCLQSPRGWAGPQPAGSSLHLLGPFVLRTAGSVFRPVNFLSLFCCPTV